MPDINWFVLSSVLAASFGVCALLVLTQRWHGTVSMDHDLSGAQKVHTTPVPRVGGLGVMLGLAIGVAVGSQVGGSTWPYVAKMLACTAPVFVAGLVEDLTKRVSVRSRLLASFVSAALAVWLMDAQLVKLDTPWLDEIIALAPVAFLFTCFAVGGLTNAINIIDGLNGLASGAVSLMLAGLAAISWFAGDVLVMKLCLWGIAAMWGFLLMNYPFGRIFLGDGGAYLAGFWLAECAVLLLHRNPEVSTWAVLLCVMYPAWETVYSMYRRRVKARVSTGEPDKGHFHHHALSCLGGAFGGHARLWRQHAVTSAFIWIVIAACQIGAIFAWRDSGLAMMLIGVFVASYLAMYNALGRRATFTERVAV